MTDKIDKIFYINLEKRTDRRELIEGDLQKLISMQNALSAFPLNQESLVVGSRIWLS